MAEWNLSDKMFKGNTEQGGFIFTDDIKEFLRRLKEDIDSKTILSQSQINWIEQTIDKLAGEKLV